MRGGTSKGAYFLRTDLPEDASERDAMLLAILGTPGPRQIDGVGGGHPLTSKVAIVAPSVDAAADVDYLFLQVGVGRRFVTDRQNCGNILAGVGPFALERNIVATEPEGDVAVPIRMLNTGGIATARFAVRGGGPAYEGSCAIAGVPGTAAPIHLEFENTAGSSTGALLPSGQIVDTSDGIELTCVDNGMPVVVVRAVDVGVRGDEPCDQLEANTELRVRVESLRLAAGELMGLGDVADLTVPKMTLVSEPTLGGTICTRTFIPHRCNDAIGVFGAVSVATASLVDGTPAAALAAPLDMPGRVTVEHPTGTLDATVELQRLHDGTVVVTRSEFCAPHAN